MKTSPIQPTPAGTKPNFAVARTASDAKVLVPAVSLETIASQANREHQLATAAACNALEHATRCGELLSNAKAELGHGNFLPWLKENFAGSERTARTYIRLASNRQRVADLTNNSTNSIRGAIEALSDHAESSDLLGELDIEPAPFEISQDHGTCLIRSAYDFALFTPHIDNNFVFVSSLEPDTIGDGGSVVGGTKAVLRRFAWHCLKLSRPGVDWSCAEMAALPPDHEYSGPWDYNHFLYFSREEWRLSFLSHQPAGHCDDPL